MLLRLVNCRFIIIIINSSKHLWLRLFKSVVLEILYIFKSWNVKFVRRHLLNRTADDISANWRMGGLHSLASRV